MLPAVQMPCLVSSCETGEILNPSTMIYLRQLTNTNPFKALPHALPVLRFVEVFRNVSLTGTIMHATDSSRAAIRLIKGNGEEVSEDASIIFSDLPLEESVRLIRFQRKGGTLACIVGDLVTKAHVQLVYLLCSAYKTVRVIALTSSHTDAERLLLCTDYVHLPEIGEPPYEFTMSRYFLTKLDEINSMNGQVRLEMARGYPRDKTSAWMAANFVV